MKLLPEIVITPLLSTAENPTNDRVDGVVEAPPSIDTFKGTRVHETTFEPSIFIFAPPV